MKTEKATHSDIFQTLLYFSSIFISYPITVPLNFGCFTKMLFLNLYSCKRTATAKIGLQIMVTNQQLAMVRKLLSPFITPSQNVNHVTENMFERLLQKRVRWLVAFRFKVQMESNQTIFFFCLCFSVKVKRINRCENLCCSKLWRAIIAQILKGESTQKNVCVTLFTTFLISHLWPDLDQ